MTTAKSGMRVITKAMVRALPGEWTDEDLSNPLFIHNQYPDAELDLIGCYTNKDGSIFYLDDDGALIINRCTL